MKTAKLKFAIGQLVHHKLFDYRGVVIDADRASHARCVFRFLRKRSLCPQSRAQLKTWTRAKQQLGSAFRLGLSGAHHPKEESPACFQTGLS